MQNRNMKLEWQTCQILWRKKQLFVSDRVKAISLFKIQLYIFKKDHWHILQTTP